MTLSRDAGVAATAVAAAPLRLLLDVRRRRSLHHELLHPLAPLAEEGVVAVPTDRRRLR